jgi:hypothetical protein
MAQKDIDAMSRKIMTWLSEEGIYKDKVANDNALFHFNAESPQGSGRLINIIQPKNRDDLMLVSTDMLG